MPNPALFFNKSGRPFMSAMLILAIVFSIPLWYWYWWRIEVPPEHLCVLIHKSGNNLAPGEFIAMSTEDKGIQLQTLSEGRYFYCPIFWDWQVVPQIIIPEERVGILIRQYGKELPEGELLASDGYKGIIPQVLRPGRYPEYNPLAYKLHRYRALTIPPGHVGVVTQRIGKTPAVSNTFLVEKGERGVQKIPLSPGTYYINPYVKEVHVISLRSHRFDMVGEKHGIRFPSKDSFNITLEGSIEWFVDEKRAAEIFMKYNDDRKISFTDKIVEKVIVPNARAFSRIQGSKHFGKEFISGITRKLFQEAFLQDLITACQEEGVVIKSALVKTIRPPEKIAMVIRDREIAKREQEKFEKEKATQVSARELAMEKLMVHRQEQVTNAQKEVYVAKKNADRDAEVKIINAERLKDMAERQLLAARNNASAVIYRAESKAKVIRLQNQAEADALKTAIDAFGGGKNYAKHEFLKKISPAIHSIFDNTDGVFSTFFSDFQNTKGGE
jgi:hypothetical protein